MYDVCLEWPQLLSAQHLRPVRNVLSCVPTRAAIRDILSCPTYRCTAGSTLVSVSTVQTRVMVVHELSFWTLTLLRTQVTCGMEGWHFQRSGYSGQSCRVVCMRVSHLLLVKSVSSLQESRTGWWKANAIEEKWHEFESCIHRQLVRPWANCSTSLWTPSTLYGQWRW